MLISNTYRFIFIKTVKTAGTSIEVDLSKIMGDGDTVTPILPVEEGHVPRNYKFQLRRGQQVAQGAFYNHMPAAEVRSIVGPQIFNSYFKFTVEREPVSKCISHYSMLKNSPLHNKKTEALSWEDYVENGSFPVDHGKYLDAEGTLLVDRIIKYETLNDDLHRIAGELGFAFPGVTAQAKSGFREAIAVTAAQRQRIYEAFRISLEVTGYRL